jgi:L-rhamnose mutarotase
MQRKAFKMKLKPGIVAEYKKRHDEIWPALQKELHAAGISDYSIFFDDETLTLFATQNLPVMQKWWDYMAPLMEVHADNSPVATPLTEVFHMD